MAVNNAHSTLDTVECIYEIHYIFGMALDDGDVPSVCDISGLRISGRQFFPSEEIRQVEKMFDITITVAVMGIRY